MGRCLDAVLYFIDGIAYPAGQVGAFIKILLEMLPAVWALLYSRPVIEPHSLVAGPSGSCPT